MSALDGVKRLCSSLTSLVHPKELEKLHISFALAQNTNNATAGYVDSLVWEHGNKTVIEQTGGKFITSKTGMESMWKPIKNTFGLFLDETMELSPYALLWLDRGINATNNKEFGHQNKLVIGISCATPVAVETLNPAPALNASAFSRSTSGDSNYPFLLQLPSALGTLYIPKVWSELMKLLRYRSMNAGSDVSVVGTNAAHWDAHWMKYLLQLVYIKGYMIMYPNYMHPESNQRLTFAAAYAEPIYNRLSNGQTIYASALWGKDWGDEKELAAALSAFKPRDKPVACMDTLGRLIRYWREMTQELVDVRAFQSALPPIPVGQHTKIPKKYRFNPRTICRTFNRGTSAFTSIGPSGITILISTFNRWELLSLQLADVSKSNRVRRVLVTLHDVRLDGTDWSGRRAFYRNIEVIFLTVNVDSLNNRFVPSHLVITDAVFVVDDDMGVSLRNLHVLHDVWKHHRKQILGFNPRWFNEIRGGKVMKYVSKSSLENVVEDVVVEDIPSDEALFDTPTVSKDNNHFKKSDSKASGYGILLTKAMMIHRENLADFVCGLKTNPITGYLRLLAVVDKHFNCEDLLMNLVVGQKLNSTAAPLFVRPVDTLRDYGTSHLDAGALSSRRDHLNTRIKCLNSINNHYREHHGKRSMPVQRNYIETSLTSNGTVVLMHKIMHGRPPRVHIDCNSTKSEDPLDACHYPQIDEEFIAPQIKWRIPKIE